MDVLGGLAKLAAPRKASTIQRNVNRCKESIETKTRDLASDQVVYDIGQIIGDVEVTVFEWVGAVKLVKGIGAAAKSLPALLESLTGAAPLLADGGLLAGAAEGVGVAEGSSVLIGALSALFNVNDFADDINRLKSDAKDEKETENDDASKQEDKAENDGKSKDEHSQKSDSEAKDNSSSNYSDDGKYTGGRTQEELDNLAKDPAHSGTNRDVDIAKGKHEAEIGLDLEEKGALKDIVRDPTGSAEFIENNGTGTKWDVKGFYSDAKPSKGGFTLDKAMSKITEEFSKGQNVIIDTTNMSAEHIAQLAKEITAQGLDARVIWWGN